jgi:outer membrane protein OmpA-like peptidoglycan-associated protein
VASDPDNSTLTYSWTVGGERLAAQGPQVTFGSEGRNPGAYDVTCTVSNGELSASATSKGTIREKPNQVPTISCQTTTVSVASGASVELRANASDPDGDKLTFSWSSPAGAVGGNSSTTTFNASGVRAGSYAVTVGVDDGRGGKASCNMTVNVSERRVIAKDNCGYFTANGGTRVDNCAKAILDDIAVQMRNNSSLRANVFGYTDNSRTETSRKGLGEARAKAMATYLQGQGIDASRIQTTDGGVGSFGDNATAAGRTLNRRVEIEISPR